MNEENNVVQKQGLTIFRMICLPMVVIIVIMLLLIAAGIRYSGVIGRLNQNSKDILTQQIVSRRTFLQNNMVGEWSDLAVLAGQISSRAQTMIDDGTLSLVTLDKSPDAPIPLLSEITDDLISEMRAKRASGIFVIFNTSPLADASEPDYGLKPGIHIRDRDPLSYASVRNEDLTLLCASTAMVRRMTITMDGAWTPQFDFSQSERSVYYDFFYKPFQAAYEATGIKNASDFGYWGLAPFGDDDDAPYTISYTVPLLLDDGTVLGVLGVDLTTDYLKDLLPYEELYENEEGAYLLSVAKKPEEGSEYEVFRDTVTLRPVLLSTSSDALKEEMSRLKGLVELTYAASEEDGSYRVSIGGTEYYADGSILDLYSNNAPFENDVWILTGLVEAGSLFRFPQYVLSSLTIVMGLTALLGLLVSIMISSRMSRSIRRLSDEVEEARKVRGLIPKLSATGVKEIDTFSDAITQLSRDVVNASMQEQKKIEHERDYDLLTGLMNRRAFYRAGEQLFAEESKMKITAMLMMDLDNLKVINDRYGHDWGDQYIHKAAEVFAASVPPSTIVSRVSGDEFYLLFYGYDAKDEIRHLVRMLFLTISETDFPLPGNARDTLHVSGGLAWYPDDSRDFYELLKQADFAMYNVKMSGKGRYTEFDKEVFNRHNQTLQGIEELETLLHSRELMSYYFQPIIDAKTGEVHAYEALMRVNMPTLQSPDAVLHYARRERRLHEIERMTWNRALASYRTLLESGSVPDGAYLFINSIASQFLNPEEVQELSERFSAILPRVIIEITEAEDMSEEALNAKKAIPFFSGLFALDDYGTGYNTDLMLFQLNPKYVKVDISFVRGIDENPDTQRLVANLVDYAHERDMRIIAEGIETQKELEQLLSMGVDLLQGYYLAMPEPVVTTINPDALHVIRTFHAE